MTKSEAQETYKLIRIVNENGLSHILNSAIVSKKLDTDLVKLLEKNGINLKSKSLDDEIDKAIGDAEGTTSDSLAALKAKMGLNKKD